MVSLPAETQDGQRVTISATRVSRRSPQCNQTRGGRCRSVSNRVSVPQREPGTFESDHYEAYCRVVETCGDRPVVIRTLDIGADKVPQLMADQFGQKSESDAGIAQHSAQSFAIRADVQASTAGDSAGIGSRNVRIMFPLVRRCWSSVRPR